MISSDLSFPFARAPLLLLLRWLLIVQYGRLLPPITANDVRERVRGARGASSNLHARIIFNGSNELSSRPRRPAEETPNELTTGAQCASEMEIKARTRWGKCIMISSYMRSQRNGSQNWFNKFQCVESQINRIKIRSGGRRRRKDEANRLNGRKQFNKCLCQPCY